MPKVLLPVGDGTEVLDTLYPYFRLPEDGFEVVIAGPEARLYHGVMHEVPPDPDVPWDITREQPAYHVKATVAFREVDPGQYAGLFLSGGRAPEYLRLNEQVLATVRHFAERNKPIAANCHGAQLLAAAGVLRGRSCTAYPACAPEVTAAGGRWVDVGFEQAHVDGNLVTAAAWPAHPQWLARFLAVLGTRIEL